eukprot:15336241-Ditylum_brightwellii.AAC.1
MLLTFEGITEVYFDDELSSGEFDAFKAASLAVIDSFDRGELAYLFSLAVMETKEVSDDVIVAKDRFGECRYRVFSCVTFGRETKRKKIWQ